LFLKKADKNFFGDIGHCVRRKNRSSLVFFLHFVPTSHRDLIEPLCPSSVLLPASEARSILRPPFSQIRGQLAPETPRDSKWRKVALQTESLKNVSLRRVSVSDFETLSAPFPSPVFSACESVFTFIRFSPVVGAVSPFFAAHILASRAPRPRALLPLLSLSAILLEQLVKMTSASPFFPLAFFDHRYSICAAFSSPVLPFSLSEDCPPRCLR